MRRREFLAAAAPVLSAQSGRVKKVQGWRIEFGAHGNIMSLRNGQTELIAPGQRAAGARVTGASIVDATTGLIDLGDGMVALEQRVGVRPSGAPNGDVRVELPRSVRLPAEHRKTFLPLKNGVGWTGEAVDGEPVFAFSGGHGATKPVELAIPMIDEYQHESGLHVTYCADPYFSTAFGDSFRWIYPSNPGLRQRDQRTFYSVLHHGGVEGAMRAFYASALRSVRPGPAWLHDIAMVDYDYLSKNGAGWFRDIDTLEKVIAREDRHKVLLALHGWYDYCGRYTFNPRTGMLDRSWTALPAAQSPAVQQMAERPDNGNAFYWPPASIRALRPVPMTIEDVHRRIRYAKDPGFRVALYYADGLNACDGTKDIFDPSKVLKWGGWSGPDTTGKSYVLNPLHPEVRRFFVDYLRALLNEYGREFDALIWDETFYVQPGDLGASAYPGYAATAMMRLVDELRGITERYGPELAFLASDDIGVVRHYTAPYAMVAHGTYQDSGMLERGWPYGLFPNYRNVLWSCNWAPTKAFDRTVYAAETFDVPMALSNGYAEDCGVSDMTPQQLKKILDLFEQRKRRRMEITWMKERGRNFTYRGRAVTARPS